MRGDTNRSPAVKTILLKVLSAIRDLLIGSAVNMGLITRGSGDRGQSRSALAGRVGDSSCRGCVMLPWIDRAGPAVRLTR